MMEKHIYRATSKRRCSGYRTDLHHYHNVPPVPPQLFSISSEHNLCLSKRHVHTDYQRHQTRLPSALSFRCSLFVMCKFSLEMSVHADCQKNCALSLQRSSHSTVVAPFNPPTSSRSSSLLTIRAYTTQRTHLEPAKASYSPLHE